ncbi:hypothetical protein G6F57_018084 [Rhizopus arrhizus]|nr:hypothetical protein G6F57_018084 [Rhizopus arrhizus]
MRGRRQEGVRDAVACHQFQGGGAVELLETTRQHGHAVVPRRQQHIQQAADPGPVGRRPHQLGVFGEELVRHLHAGQMPQQDAMRVQRALGLARGTGRIEDEERMLGVDRHGLAGVGLAGFDLVHPQVAAFGPLDLATRAAIHDDLGNGFAAAHCDGVFHRDFQRNRLAAAYLLVGGAAQRCAHVPDALLQALGRAAPARPRDLRGCVVLSLGRFRPVRACGCSCPPPCCLDQ